MSNVDQRVRRRTTLRMLWRSVQRSLPTLYSGYFAMVMATAIVSIAALFQHHYTISRDLLWVAVGGYGVLIVAYVGRALFYWSHFAADLLDPEQTFTYFTFVAGTAVLGVRFFLGGDQKVTAIALALAATVWVVLTYLSMGALIVRARKSEPTRAVNGGWLLAIVGTQAASILTTLESSSQPPAVASTMLLASYAFWASGVILYGVFIVLIVFRLFFTHLQRHDLAPPYWINMGGTAITALAGARLLQQHAAPPFLVHLDPFIGGVSLALWAWGTWWIPLLVLISAWRYIALKVPFHYEPPLWSMVFPIGMYSVASYQLGAALGVPFLRSIAAPAWWAAIAVWLLVALSMARAWLGTARKIMVMSSAPNSPGGRAMTPSN